MPEGLAYIGKFLIVSGLVVTALGVLLLAAGTSGWLGRLPGDIVVERKNVTFYFPLMTGIVLSVILTLVFWLLGKR